MSSHSWNTNTSLWRSGNPKCFTHRLLKQHSQIPSTHGLSASQSVLNKRLSLKKIWDSDMPNASPLWLPHMMQSQASSNSKPFDCSTVNTKELLNTLGKSFRDSSFRTKMHWLAPNAIPALPSCPSNSARFFGGRLGMLHQLVLLLPS